MFKSGNILIYSFSEFIIFLSLAPALIILIRRIYREEILNFLMILSLLYLIERIVLSLVSVLCLSPAYLHLIFSFLEFIVFIQLFKTGLSLQSRTVLNMVIVAFFSSLVTYYLVTGTEKYLLEADIFENLIIAGMATACIYKLAQKDNLQIFRSPLFLIALGTLFYLFVALLLNFSNWYGLPTTAMLIDEKILLLDIAALVRCCFYIYTAIVYNGSKKEEGPTV